MAWSNSHIADRKVIQVPRSWHSYETAISRNDLLNLILAPRPHHQKGCYATQLKLGSGHNWGQGLSSSKLKPRLIWGSRCGGRSRIVFCGLWDSLIMRQGSTIEEPLIPYSPRYNYARDKATGKLLLSLIWKVISWSRKNIIIGRALTEFFVTVFLSLNQVW